MKIQFVALDFVHVIWDQIAPFFQASMDGGGTYEYTLDQVKVRVTDGTWQVLVAVDDSNQIVGAAAVSFFNRPDARVGYINMLGGRLITGQDEFKQLMTYMQSHGATMIEASVRESVARLLNRHGFTEKYRVVGVKI